MARIQDKRQHDRRRRGRKTRRMRREFVLRAVSHNVQSLRQPESIELVISDAGSTRLGGHGEGSGVVEAVGYERHVLHTDPQGESKSCLRGWRLTAASFYSCTSTPTPARTTRSQLAMMVPTEWRSLRQKLAGGTKLPFSGSLCALLGLPGKWCCSWQQ